MWAISFNMIFFFFYNTINVKIYLSYQETVFLQDEKLCMSSSVKTDWNCSFNTLAFAQLDVAGKPELVLRVRMPVFSLCNIYMLYMIKRI